MSQPRKYRLPVPPPTEVPPSPAEIIEGYPIPRVQLVIVLRIDPGTDAAKAALCGAQLISAVHAAERRLRFTFDARRSHSAGEEVTIVLSPSAWGTVARQQLDKVIGVVREAAAAVEGATLSRAEVVPQT
jgi:hypothetical protein